MQVSNPDLSLAKGGSAQIQDFCSVSGRGSGADSVCRLGRALLPDLPPVLRTLLILSVFKQTVPVTATVSKKA